MQGTKTCRDGVVLVDDAALHKNLTVLAKDPRGGEGQRFLRDVGLERKVQFRGGIGLQLGGMRDEADERGEDLLADEVSGELQDAKDGVNVPALVRCEALSGEADLRGQPELELVVGDLEESEQLADEYAHVLLVDEGVRELERAPADRDVAVAQAVENDVPMALHRIGVHRHDLVQGVECNIPGVPVSRGSLLIKRDAPNIVVLVAQELAQDVDRHYPQPSVCFNLQYSQDGFIQNRVADVFRRVCICRNLIDCQRLLW